MPLKMLNKPKHKHRQRKTNPTPEKDEAFAAATDERLKANNQFNQYDAAFKQTFTEQEQKDLSKWFKKALLHELN